MEIQMDSWEKLETKRGYCEVLLGAADGDGMSMEIILPKKCKDRSKEMDCREHIYAEAKEKRQKVQKEGRKKFATKRWLGSFANIGDDGVRAGAGVAVTYSLIIAKYSTGILFPALGAAIGLAAFGVYAVHEIANFAAKQELYDRIIENFERPEENIDLKFIYTDNPDEIHNKILLPHDSLDKLRENHPEAYEELKKLMDGKCALRKYDFVEEFGEKHPEAFKELKTVAMEQEPYDYSFHTRRMK